MLYDRAIWLERTKKRLEKLSPERRSLAESIDMRAISGIEIVLDWCNKRSLSVIWVPSCGGEYDPSEREITVNYTSSPVIQLSVLLHECGHHLMGKTGGITTNIFRAKDAAKKPVYDLRARIDILEKEYVAWKRGWHLGLRLGALTEEDGFAYDSYRVRMLKSYIKWVQEAKR